MKKAYIVFAVFAVIFISSSAWKPQKIVIVKRFNEDIDCQNYILKKASEGYCVKQLVTYNDGSPSMSEFMVVMER